MNHRQRLRGLLADPHAATTPGAFDALSALLCDQAGFEAAFLSGSAVAYTQLARPDVGLVTLTEMAQTMDRVRDRVAMPVLVDADQGYGNALSVQRCVRVLERAGASGIQIEDQLPSKPLAQATQRPLISEAEMCGKIRAALDAREDDATVISARTDSVFTVGLDAALDRASAFAAAGADMVFVEGLNDRSARAALRQRVGANVPLLHHVLPDERDNPSHRDVLAELDYAIALYPAALIGAVLPAMRRSLASLPRSVAAKDIGDDSVAKTVGLEEVGHSADRYAK